MRTIESSGKTVEEALSAGLKELGCDISEVTHEVLDKGSTGLFGMFGRLARVRITVKEKDPDFDFEMPVLSLTPQNAEGEKKPARKEKSAEPKQKKEKPAKEAKAEKPAEEAAPAAEVKAEEPAAPAEEKAEPKAEKPARKRTRQPKKEKPQQPENAEEPLAPAEEMAEPAPAKPELPPLDVDALGESGKRAYEFLSNVTKLMGVDVEIRMLEEENHLTIEMTGDTLGVLIGRRGETMDAIQYLTSLTVNKEKSEYTRVSLDVEHYRAKREETLRKLALRMANRAKKSGRRVVLEPMNPYERRVMHSALQNHPYVQTHSEGEEPYRRVIITLK
ncbi:MAG: protein jag [Clostridia bacterium]|nr:protein jag [Clostridia bacterium]